MQTATKSNPVWALGLSPEDDFIRGYVSVHTQNTYRNAIKDFFGVEKLGYITAEAITSVGLKDVQNYIKEMLKDNLKSGTIRTRVSALRSFYDYLVLYDYFKIVNPFKSKAVNKLLRNNLEKEDNLPKTEMVTREALEKIYAAVDLSTKAGQRDYLVLKLLVNTGLRREEVSNIRPCDFKVTDNGFMLHVLGKGRKSREIPVSDEMIKMVSEYAGIKMPSQKEEYMFVSMGNRSSCKLTPRSIGMIVERYCKSAGVDNISPHSFRHLNITWLINEGANVALVQHRAGHSNVNTTMRYFHKYDVYQDQFKMNL
jgi:integrase/recombinase XerD